ncbi:type II toxin-antitoxin system VapC family toxin [Actinospica sp. MGRD01-02]|uniref:Type II toxin-antitoxin system VapC family toxin n=1 Tax=Actinospica acidithermotolerans TaxID=2828514 RepID=A0A941IK11_9ACTN|nr:type II toxin-antitoxin system VapC family toxin [Actinospica acidithermotolerans]MBR7831345.1 type II toxin-antitoxin system VapC family toxin [Actinospica acidithermotolerans]
MSERKPIGLLDTRTLIDIEDIPDERLPIVSEVCAISMAELMMGVHMARDAADRSARITKLLTVGANFDPLPFGDKATNSFNALVGLTVAIGRNPKPRKNDLMIAATAVANGLPLYTANIDEFKGLESMLEVVEVRRR